MKVLIVALVVLLTVGTVLGDSCCNKDNEKPKTTEDLEKPPDSARSQVRVCPGTGEEFCGCRKKPCTCKPSAAQMKPFSVPVKVSCEPRASEAPPCGPPPPEPCCEELRYLKEAVAKKNVKITKGRIQGVCGEKDLDCSTKFTKPCCGGSSATCAQPSLSRKEPISVCVECEKCEMQVKANGDGVVLRCNKCRPAHPEQMNFVHTGLPHKIVKLPA